MFPFCFSKKRTAAWKTENKLRFKKLSFLFWCKEVYEKKWTIEGIFVEGNKYFIELELHLIIVNEKSLQMMIATMKLKDAYSLEGKLWPT